MTVQELIRRLCRHDGKAVVLVSTLEGFFPVEEVGEMDTVRTPAPIVLHPGTEEYNPEGDE